MIVNYAFKLNDMEKTRGLAEHIYYEETEGSQGAALAVIDAQAEIDALPDLMIGLWEMEEYGYSREEMLPLTKETALELFDRDLPVYQLHEDGSETLIRERRQVTEYEGIFGIEKADWENEKSLLALQEELSEYNMVDNVLNNGAGEKTQKEENRKAQDKPAAKPSLKARLAEKKAQVAGQGREQEENIKNKQREM